MKKLLIILLCLIFTLCFSSCGGDNKKSKVSVAGATDDEANYPTPKENKYVESDGETGMRLNYTLESFTTEFNTMYEALGGKTSDFPYEKWKKAGEEKGSDNGLNYEYFSLTNDKITLTATVDTASRQLINIGCGISVKNFYANKNNEQKVMTICGSIAAVAGGYDRDSVPFFGNLYVDTISNEDHCFWYNNAIYIYERRENKGESVMHFRVMPAEDGIDKRWDIKDYKEFWFK